MQWHSQKESTASKILFFCPELILLILACFLFGGKLQSDFWNDEIYTLKHFTFTSLRTTISDYHVPNNHVLFNLINNIYLRTIGMESLHELMDHPWMMRIIPMTYGLGTCILVYKTGHFLSGKPAAVYSVLLLLTSIPFYNFAMQLRGYGLSMLLLSATVYCSLVYHSRGGLRYLILTACLIAAMLYTLPSNIYFVLSFVLFFGIFFIRDMVAALRLRSSNAFQVVLRGKAFHVALAILCGTLLALLLYLKIFEEVFFNPYVIPGPSFENQKLVYYFSGFYTALFAERWYIIVFLLTGFCFLRKANLPNSVYLFLSLVLALLPFLLVYTRGDNAPLRVFTVMVPSLMLLPGVAAEIWFRQFQKWRARSILTGSFISAVLIVVFFMRVHDIDQKIYHDIKNEIRSQDLVYQYYASHFHPLQDVKALEMAFLNHGCPINIAGGELHGIPNYVEKEMLPYTFEADMDSLFGMYDSIYIVTNRPYQYLESTLFETQMISPSISYNTVLLMHKNSQFYASQSRLSDLLKLYGDSMALVLDEELNSLLPSSWPSTDVFSLSLSDLSRMHELKVYIDKFPLVCLVSDKWMEHKQTYAVVADQKFKVQDETDNLHIALFQKSHSLKLTPAKTQELFTADREFGRSSKVAIGDVTPLGFISVSFDAGILLHNKALLVFSLYKNGEHLIWHGEPLAAYRFDDQPEARVVVAFSDFSNALATDSLSIYIWNPEKESFWVGEMSINLLP